MNFETVGSSHGLFHHLVQHDIRLPFRNNRSNPAAPIEWRLPGKSTVYGLLKHPLYAGAYGYGRRTRYPKKTGQKPTKKHLPPDQWKVLLQDIYPAYISWDQYIQNQRRLSENDNVGDRRGAVRVGSALLAGIIKCAHCGRRLSPNYPKGSHPTYTCGRHWTVASARPCYSTIRCETLDGFVASKLLEVLAPAGVELSLRVIEDEQARREQLETLHVQRVAQAQYAVDLAERRYQQVDPANRLVAAQLERQWEESLKALDIATAELDELRSQHSIKLNDSDRERLQTACADVAALWKTGASIEERKQIARLLLERVDVEVHDNSERVSVTLHWSGGFESIHQISRAVQRFDQLESYDTLVDRTLELTLAGKRSPEVATILEREGYRSPRSDRPISSMMVQKLLLENSHCHKQLTDPSREPGHWRAADLAREVGVAEKRLKHWVSRGWATAIQRPFGRTWVIYADQPEVTRLKALARSQQGQGRPKPPKELRTPAVSPRKRQ